LKVLGVVQISSQCEAGEDDLTVMATLRVSNAAGRRRDQLLKGGRGGPGAGARRLG
jgi:hypothetical protein